jgi:hypothetical protein
MAMTKLPAAFTETTIAVLDRWWTNAGVLTTSEGARAVMQGNLSQHLHAGTMATVPLAHIVMMADAGIEQAQRALGEYIASAIDRDRFQELPVGLRDYSKRVMIARELPGYGRGNKIIDTWTRDIVIRFLVIRAMEHWRLKKKQAAALVALMLKRRGIKPSSTRQVLDIYDSRDTLSERVVRFMMSAVPEDEPDGGAV